MQTPAGTKVLHKNVFYLRSFEVNFIEIGTQYTAQ